MNNSPRLPAPRAGLLLTLIFAGSALSCMMMSAGHHHRGGHHRPGMETHSVLPPQSSRIEGTILAILPPDAAATGVCAEVSCLARVRIDAVKGYGAGFRTALAAGDTITVFFELTLADTRTVFPNLQQHYPGLQRADRFQALVYETAPEPQVGSQQPVAEFRISAYQRIE